MYIAILGRQPELGAAELERLYGDVSWFSEDSVTVSTESISINRLGGSQKIGRVVKELQQTDWPSVSKFLVSHFNESFAESDHKITLGISAYGFRINPRDIQKTGLVIKSKLKAHGVSLRLIPNQDAVLSTATSHHNKLGLSPHKVELIIVRGKKSIIIAESVGSQNITAYAARDQGRPKRDAFVGMLPPKLAQIIVNLTGSHTKGSRILDPFCGTGVLLQESLLLGYNAYGTDLSEKMIDFSGQNLAWITNKYNLSQTYDLAVGDAMDYRWQPPITAVATETYLGQPFSAPPSPAKLREVQGNCNHIIGSFLRNLSSQLPSGTPVCLGVPAWRDKSGNFTHLPLIRTVESYGFQKVPLSTSQQPLLYYRENQVVARELLILKKV